MAITEQTFSVSCRGGLDRTSNTQELLKLPNLATRLMNFESTVEGGYRRINGYQKLGNGEIAEGGTLPIDGITVFNNGFLLCKSSKMYYTLDGETFTPVNKSLDYVNFPEGQSYDDLVAAPLIPRDFAGPYQFQQFSLGTKKILMGVCQNNKPFRLTISGDTVEDSIYSYKEVNLTTGTLIGAKVCEKYKDQLVIAGMDDAPDSIYYSDILKPDDFEGANAGSIGFNDEVVGIKMFRENLYVFCKNSIHVVTGLETGSPQRKSLTENIGCLASGSIQEINGDLVFLAPDGLRTLSATERLGDLNLSTLSNKIGPPLLINIKQLRNYVVQSVVLKAKAQYRIFFTPVNANSAVAQVGYIMYLNQGQQGISTEFSQIKGFNVSCIYNGYVDNQEVTISGGTNGKFYYHDVGEDFDGKNIPFLYQSPYFDMGDPAYRKNIKKLITYLTLEGDTHFNIQVRYDYDNPEAYNPPPRTSGHLNAPAIYSETNYKTSGSKYSSVSQPRLSTLMEGSGKTVAIRIFPSGSKCAPFNVQGFDVYHTVGGRI